MLFHSLTGLVMFIANVMNTSQGSSSALSITVTLLFRKMMSKHMYIVQTVTRSGRYEFSIRYNDRISNCKVCYFTD